MMTDDARPTLTTLETMFGQRGPFRDERGRFRRRAEHERGSMDRLLQASARQAAQTMLNHAQLLTGRQWVKVVGDQPAIRISPIDVSTDKC